MASRLTAPPTGPRSAIARYGIAVLSSGVCMAGHLALAPIYPDDRANFLVLAPSLLVGAPWRAWAGRC
jgi:hypothetical protein